MYRTAIGQDSHRFDPSDSVKPLVLGGVPIPGCAGLQGNSDADVVLHALTNAVSGISGVNVLGKISDEMCLKQGITDSRAYLARALEALDDCVVTHASISIEAKTPRLEPHIGAMRESVARLLGLRNDRVGITATSGEGLTAAGRGEGIAVTAVVSVAARKAQ
jgi:2-C-methyl-D-erythritol 2,4-cyclodiphosphate synthase